MDILLSATRSLSYSMLRRHSPQLFLMILELFSAPMEMEEEIHWLLAYQEAKKIHGNLASSMKLVSLSTHESIAKHFQSALNGMGPIRQAVA